MNTETTPNRLPLQRFATDPDRYYPIDVAARLAEMPRHVLLVCCRLGIVAPRIDPDFGGFSFHRKDIQSLQHIEYLRSGCGVNLAGIQIILKLLMNCSDSARSRAIEITRLDLTVAWRLATTVRQTGPSFCPRNPHIRNHQSRSRRGESQSEASASNHDYAHEHFGYVAV